jgi:WD40 repeat protein
MPEYGVTKLQGWVAIMGIKSIVRWALPLVAFWSATIETAISASDPASKVVELTTAVPTADVWGLAFNEDGSLLAVASAAQIDIWDWNKRKVITTLHQPRGARSLFNVNPVQFSVDGNFLMACGSLAVRDIVIRVWNTRDWSIAKDITNGEAGGCNAMTLSPNGKLLAYVAESNRPRVGSNVVVIETESWTVSWKLGTEDFYTATSVSFSPDSKTLAFAGYLFSLNTAANNGAEGTPRFLYKFTTHLVDVGKHAVQRSIPCQAGRPLVWNPAGTRLANADGGTVEFMDVPAGETLAQFSEKTAHMDAKYSPDGRLFLDTDMNGLGTGRGLHIWNFDRSRLLQEIKGNIGTIAFSRDGRHFAAGGSGSTTIWQVNSL